MKKYSLLCCFLTAVGFAQQNITGTITDTDNQLIPGVSIFEKGTTNGTVSDFEGNYKINTTTKNATLIFSFVGYEKQFISTGDKTLINVKLSQGNQLEEVVIVGSRNPKRTVIDSPVPIDVIDVQKLSATNGKVDVNDLLQYAAPSFNATKQSGSDGADHIVPASLRGLGPDQTLVLINGKRRHQSSLVNVFGTRGRGNSGTDLNAIPTFAIKRIEVLRDGASAQYGSDAIAGVINIVLKDDTKGFTSSLSYGAYSTSIGKGWAEKAKATLYNVEGKNRLDGKEKSFDGNTLKLDLNYGLPLSDKGGFINFTTELLSKEKTLRPGFSGRKGYGSAGVNGFNFMMNFALPISKKTEIYAFGGRNYKNTNANAYTRGAFNDTKTKDKSLELRTVASLYPNGFTPRITSIITDFSFSSGIRHVSDKGWKVDFNNTFGKNYFHYYVKNTNNASLKNASPNNFDAGGHSLSQNTTGVDFSNYFEDILEGVNIAFGLEYRTENFVIFSGEETSWGTYDTDGNVITDRVNQRVATSTNGNPLPGGSQGFPGYSPDNETDRSRTNVGVYFDTELNFSKSFLMGFAFRFEDYSDFGSTFNYKADSRFKVTEHLSIRGSISSGFRAPSLAQIYYNLTFNNIVKGKSLPSLLASNTSNMAKAFGIGNLKQETSFNYSLGATFKIENFTATIDAYIITVDNRIILTDNFDATKLNVGVEKAQFFANGLDTRTKGIDFILGYKNSFNRHQLAVNFIGNINKLDIKKILNGNLNKFTFFGPFSQAYLEAAAPDYKLGLNLNYTYKKLDLALMFTQFSSVTIQDFQWVDTPATTQAQADDLFKKATDVYGAKLTTDLSVSYAFSKELRLTVGGNNIFNVYPTPQFDGWTDQGGLADSVQMGSDGAYFFTRLGFSF